MLESSLPSAIARIGHSTLARSPLSSCTSMRSPASTGACVKLKTWFATPALEPKGVSLTVRCCEAHTAFG